MLEKQALATACLWCGLFGWHFLLSAILREYFVAKHVATYSSHPDDSDGKREADKDVQAAARLITNAGEGSTHYAKVERKAGDIQVNIYKR